MCVVGAAQRNAPGFLLTISLHGSCAVGTDDGDLLRHNSRDAVSNRLLKSEGQLTKSSRIAAGRREATHLCRRLIPALHARYAARHLKSRGDLVGAGSVPKDRKVLSSLLFLFACYSSMASAVSRSAKDGHSNGEVAFETLLLELSEEAVSQHCRQHCWVWVDRCVRGGMSDSSLCGMV